MRTESLKKAQKKYYEANKKTINLKRHELRKKLMEAGKIHLQNCVQKIIS